ncbi:TetR/AcrR family transcriptional regulator C-terminal domain-containing protein [Paenibacillus tarimensis]
MSETMDRRKAKTKRSLRQALIEVMEERGVERITVSALIEKADINRSTFYLHYADAPDLLRQVKAEIWEGLKQRMEQLNPYDYLSYAARNMPDPTMVKIIEYFAEHADFFKVILGPKGDPAFARDIKEFLKNQHISKIFDIQPDLAKTIVPKDYMIAYFAASNLSILLHWMETGMRHSPGTLALMITHIVGSGAKHLLGIEAEY